MTEDKGTKCDQESAAEVNEFTYKIILNTYFTSVHLQVGARTQPKFGNDSTARASEDILHRHLPDGIIQHTDIISPHEQH